MWTLVPLGNPGDEYALTRHNLGRLLLERWIGAEGLKPARLKKFNSGVLFRLTPQLQALVPVTYMNLSGEACEQASAAGIPAERQILLYDDKDLPLGLGRLRQDGNHGGHNGLRSAMEHQGTTSLPRLRLGIGPKPPATSLHDFVLGSWTPEEMVRIQAMDRPFAAFLERLERAQDLGKLASLVNAVNFWGAGAETKP